MKKFLLTSLICLSALTFAPQAHAKLVDVQTTQQLNDLINKGNVVIDFYAPFNCGPCNALAPVINALATEYPHITFIKLNGGKFGNVMSQYNVSAYPTLVFLKDGVRMEVVRGGKNKSALKSMLDRLFATR
ncbi:MAG: thioredoxin family protein [Candidatus Babeliales bacterium]|nr:thioredoxin family protein [Candidatus Babeliales bacterium]